MRTLAKPADVAEIVERLGRLTPESQRRFGTLTAREMLCHCADAFRHATGEVESRSVSTLLNRTVIKFVAMWTPVPWPRGVPTTREMDTKRGGTKPGDFARDRAALESAMRRFIEMAPAMPRPHAAFGRMSERTWLRWGYLHTNHHLRQFGV